MTIPPGTITDLLGIVLKQNYFQFANNMFHQIQGTAMGTKMAPSYANIIMAELEEKNLPNKPTIMEKIHRRHPMHLARPTIRAEPIYDIPQPIPPHYQVYP